MTQFKDLQCYSVLWLNLMLWFDAYQLRRTKRRWKKAATLIKWEEISFETDDDDDTSMVIILWDYRNPLLSSFFLLNVSSQMCSSLTAVHLCWKRWKYIPIKHRSIERTEIIAVPCKICLLHIFAFNAKNIVYIEWKSRKSWWFYW